MSDKITIVTVTFNAGNLLEKTIKSVISQNYKNLEYIIIDGNSKDNTKDIIEKYKDHIFYHESKPDSGIYHAMNKAIDKSTGAWINFMNAGDIFSDNNVLQKVGADLDEEYDFVYGDRYRVSLSGNRKLEYAGEVKKTLEREVVFHQALFTKAEYLKSEHYNTCYKLAADYELIVKSYMKGKNFKKLSYEICDFLEGGKSRENFYLAQIEASKIIIENCKNSNALKNNMYFENLVKVSIGYVLNKYIQIEKNNDKDFSIIVTPQSISKRLLSTNTLSSQLNDFLGRINEPLTKARINYKKSLINNFKHFIKYYLSSIDSFIKKIPSFRLERNSSFYGAGKMDNSNDINSRAFDVSDSDLRKITVVTVTLNAEKYVEKTLSSVVSQTHPNIEYIVIDGGSTDNTNIIIDNYKNNISKHIIENDEGLYYAMNKGINYATGDYILFLNAGDTFPDNETLKTLSALNNMNNDVIYGDRYYVHNMKRELEKAKKIDTIFQRMPFCHQSCLVKRDVLKKYKFNTTFKYAADYELFVRLYKDNMSFCYIDMPICNFESGGLSESGIRPYLEVLKVLFDYCDDKEAIKNSVYFRGFKNTFSDLVDF